MSNVTRKIAARLIAEAHAADQFEEVKAFEFRMADQIEAYLDAQGPSLLTSTSVRGSGDGWLKK